MLYKNKKILLFLACSLFFLAWGLEWYGNSDWAVKHYTKKLQTKLHKYEREVKGLLTDGAFVSKAINDAFSDSDWEHQLELAEKPYTICV